MMRTHFVFRGLDRPGKAIVRQAIREEHRAYIRRDQPGCRCVAGGPLFDDAGQTMLGTMLIFEAEERAAVETFLAGDPYAGHDLFETVEIYRWNWGLGTPPE